MDIFTFSDTHGKHRFFEKQHPFPKADMAIFAGDFSAIGNLVDAVDFIGWFANLPYEYLIFIAGNHDIQMEQLRNQVYIPDNVIYLENSGITIEGIDIWGSPITPTFSNWAFLADRGAEIRKYWDLIPKDTDILITHGPPMGIQDWVPRVGANLGCEELRERLEDINFTYHLHGHMHDNGGIETINNKTHVGTSVLNEQYTVSRPGHLITL